MCRFSTHFKDKKVLEYNVSLFPSQKNKLQLKYDSERFSAQKPKYELDKYFENSMALWGNPTHYI